MDWSLTPKSSVSKTLRIPADVVEELEQIALENSTDEATYTFTDVTVELLRKAIQQYRVQHPRGAEDRTKRTPKRE